MNKINSLVTVFATVAIAVFAWISSKTQKRLADLERPNLVFDLIFDNGRIEVDGQSKISFKTLDSHGNLVLPVKIKNVGRMAAINISVNCPCPDYKQNELNLGKWAAYLNSQQATADVIYEPCFYIHLKCVFLIGNIFK